MPLFGPPQRNYNAASAIADEIWQYCMGGSLTVFDKDHDTAEEGRSQVRQKQGSCSQAYRSEIYLFFKEGWKLVTLVAVRY